MNIRKIQIQELLPALHLAAEVFAEDVAPAYTDEGVGRFHEFISYDSFREMFERQEVTIFGAFEGVQICGMIAVTNSGHISLFFVRKAFQRHGIGRMLYLAAVAFAAREVHTFKITVNAAPQAVETYEHLGMHKVTEEQEKDGIRFVPMEAELVQCAYGQYSYHYGTENPGQNTYGYGAGSSSSGSYSYGPGPEENGQGPAGTYSHQVQMPQRKSAVPVIVGVVVAIILLIVAVGGAFLFGSFIYYKAKDDVGITEDQPYEDDGDSWDDSDDIYDNDENNGNSGSDSQNKTDESSVSGVDKIEAYKADNLSYKVKNETYSFRDSEKTSTIIDFNVAYPQINGLKGKNADKINKTIKNCAMSTVDEIYTHPDEKIKQKVIEANTPALISYVKCKVTYATNEFISVVFEDTSARGEYSEYQTDLRTVNIRLRDGKIYEVRDIVKLDDTFVENWAKIMQKETGDSSFLTDLTTAEMKKALEGNDKTGAYVPNFFVSKDGIEIGFNMGSASSGKQSTKYAWVTAPYTFDEIKSSVADTAFWKELDR